MTEASPETGGQWISKLLEEHPPPDSLPSGWLIRDSRSQPGCFYYYNQETGECQWEKPTAVAPVLLNNNNNSDIYNSTDNNSNKPAVFDLSSAAIAAVAAKATAALQATMQASASQATSSKSSSEQPPTKKLKSTLNASSSTTTTTTTRTTSAPPTEVRVLHILKKHVHSRRPSSWRMPKVTLTKEEATAELRELVSVLQEVSDNPDELRATFEELARTESDCSSAKRGGDLGFFGRKKMQPTFEEASFALRVGQMSDIIESSSGVHVILRIG